MADAAAGAPQMPEPVAYRWIPSETWRDYVHSNGAALRDIALECGAPVENLVTAASARAYGQAMAEHARRVALEEAADRCEAIAHKYMHLTDDRISDAADECKDAIRAAAQTQGGT
jgi:hypothetical protein